MTLNEGVLLSKPEHLPTTARVCPCCSAVTAQAGVLVAPPSCTHTGACLVVVVALAPQPTVCLASTGQATQLTVLVHRVADPVGTRILQAARDGSNTT